jgi:uncharacterized protein (TIGR03083 family)
MTDWGALYRDHVAALGELAPALTEEQLTTPVPATPDWTVHEVLAHLAGVGHDALAGRMDGAPGAEWTERHVGERRDLTVAELLGELESDQQGIAESVADNPAPAFVWNLVVHHADLHEALGLPRLPDRLWEPVAEAMAQRLPELAAAVEPYELFRAAFSRRSRSQMQAWGTGLSDEDLDAACIFGPREDDQPVPG